MIDRKEELPPFLTPIEVSRRWQISLRTLEGWRYKGIGPTWSKLGSKVRYSREAVLRFEASGLVSLVNDHG